MLLMLKKNKTISTALNFNLDIPTFPILGSSVDFFFFRLINHRLNWNLKIRFFSIFEIFDHVWSIRQWSKNRFFFLKVLLNLVFGIAAPYKQISICPYKHRYFASYHKNFYLILVWLLVIVIFFSYRALSFIKMKNKKFNTLFRI